jgi:hypothetical protein
VKKSNDISFINLKNQVMTTRRNSSRGFGTMDSDERRRSGRGSRRSQGRSQNRDEYEMDKLVLLSFSTYAGEEQL